MSALASPLIGAVVPVFTGPDRVHKDQVLVQVEKVTPRDYGRQ